ncbi:MAG TPA: VOC family protein [Chitinophagaceae bacterium]|nr:VOC family protein [Chitinophagaceae bacterium]
MDTTTNSLNWFEIPASDLARARHFYQVIFSMHMEEGEMGGVRMAFFPYAPGSGKASGALCQSEYHRPGMDGVLVYLNGNPDLSSVLEKVEPMGGRILMAKTQINPEVGYMAMFVDTEGNRIALHSMA